MWNGNSITDTTQEAIVGQKIELSANVTGGTPSNQQWTIDGEKVKDYVVNYTGANSPTSAEVVELTSQDLSQGSVQFYWIDGGTSRQIQYSATINGQTYTATANFDVKRPTTQLTATTGTVGLGNIPISTTESVFALHYGDYYSPGISFSANATLPSGVSGDIVYVQVVSSRRTKKLVGGNEQVLQGIGLDTQFPLIEPNNGVVTDFPHEELNVPCNYTSVSADDSFTTFLMFKPQVSSGNSIYVPLRKIDWGWTGTGNRGSSCSSWVLTNANPSSPQNLTSVETTDFPEWVANITQFTFQ